MGSKLFGRRGSKRHVNQHLQFSIEQERLAEARRRSAAIAKDPIVLTWQRDHERWPPGFYTYRLLDPATGVAFYVGKGQRSRAWHHERAVQSGDLRGNRRKVEKIQQILQRGEQVEIDIVACYGRESDALDHEFRLVDANPALTNVAPGGAGAPLSEAAQARKAALRQAKLNRLRERERAESAARETADRRSAYLAQAKSPLEFAQIEAWLDGLSAAEAAKMLRPRHQALLAREAKIKPKGAGPSPL